MTAPSPLIAHDTAPTAVARPMGGTGRPPVRRVALGGVQAAALGAVATSLYGLAIRAAGVPMRAGFLGASTAQPLKTASFAMGVVVCTFWGTLLAVALARLVTNPARAFLKATVALTALSLIVPLGASHTAGATRAALLGAHVLAAAVVIPVLTRHLRMTAAPLARS